MARNFNGTTYLTLADDAALDLGDDVDSSGPFSLAFWMRKGTNPGTAARLILSWGEDGANPSIAIRILSDDHITSGVISGVFRDSFGAIVGHSGFDSITDSNWHHLVFAFDGLLLRFWVDGSQQSGFSGNSTLKTIDVAADMLFGKQTAGSNNFIGDMAELAKWDAYLTPEQITALVNGVRPTEIGMRPVRR